MVIEDEARWSRFVLFPYCYGTIAPKGRTGYSDPPNGEKSGDEFNKHSAERVEMHLTELGRRAVEIFVLAHIFSNKIEVAYQEAVILKWQEELFREEELIKFATNNANFGHLPKKFREININLTFGHPHTIVLWVNGV